MFAFLCGKVVDKQPGSVVIDCNGVGYAVEVPNGTFSALPAEGDTFKLFIHFAMSESDGIRLFGFASPEEKKMFQLLISISRIGPKIGLAILSALSVKNIIQSVSDENDDLLATVPGLGKKSAKRLIMELKDKVDKFNVVPEISPVAKLNSDLFKEAEEALITLGYKSFAIQKAFAEMKNDVFSNTEDIVKKTIKILYKNRS
ncbi:MAG: Holliday junction branch migration protein RuvA [Candidatus Cloacimonadota bacterium]|nr:MAG: Holliday junction branch migration protein RuvA [Candidatus Cloacimonadota bacterium]